MSSASDLRSKLNLEQQRKRAKELRRAHRDGSREAAERILRHLPRVRGQSVAQVLASPLTLAEAQLVVAREAGFASWPQMKREIESVALAEADIGEALIDAAFAGDETGVESLSARDPQAAKRSLSVAAALADSESALALLDADPSLASSTVGRRGWTPLLYLCCSSHRAGTAAASAARVVIARRLIACGADVNVTAIDPALTVSNVDVTWEHHWHPLEGAAGRARSVDLVQLLLDAGSTTESRSFLNAAVGSGDAQVLELALGLPWKGWQIMWALKLSVELDAEQMAQRLMARAPTPLTVERPLLEAIRLHRGLSLVQVLLGGAGNAELWRPVLQACYRAAVRFGHEGAAELLRQRGANPARLRPADLAIAACIRGDERELRRLLEARTYARSALQYEDHRMLSWALRTGRDRAVPLLLQAGLDPNYLDEQGDTPVHLAVRAGSVAMLEQVLRAGGRVEVRNLDGETPLDVALRVSEPEARDRIVRHLLEAGASAVAAPDREDMGELFEQAADAVVSGHIDRLRALLDEEPALIHARSPRAHRSTLLHYCAANGVEQFRQVTPPNAPAVAQLLLERGAEVDAVGRTYSTIDTPLYLMMTSAGPIMAGLDGELTRVFASAGARIDWGDEDGPMIWAIDAGLPRSAAALAEAGLRLDNLLFAGAVNRVDVLEELLARGADVNTRYWAGYTALHAAAVMGHEEAVELLLSRGANPALREEKYGDTPADKARWRGHTAVVELLERPATIK